MAYVSLSWLKEHVDVPVDTTVEQLALDLVKVGLEEEAIHPPAVQDPLVVGRVVSMIPEKQSNGKTINYCRVDVGQHNDEPGQGKEPSSIPSRSIVCGAHNFKEGDLVAVVLPGAVLPGPFPISSRKTYGHISDGMICSERELGLSDEHSGILVLTERYDEKDLPAVGESLLPLFDFGEEILEINITPDRGYCFSMRGIAREYFHSTGHTFVDPGLAKSLPGGVAKPTQDGFQVRIEDDAPIRGNVGCDRFVTRLVTGVDPKAPTPDWMLKRLEQAGMRSISLAVDITNYVMLDVGQPLHAYDADLVQEPLVVRRARDGEKHTTLDDVERTLSAGDLLITDCEGGDGARVLGIAGVMGGADTEVTDTTTNILVEAAHFDPVSIARSARRHKLPTESSKRFERGVDTQLMPVAAQRVVDLLVEYGGGTDTGRVLDIDNTLAPKPISMDINYPSQRVGVDYTRDRVVALLEEIGCKVDDGDDNNHIVVTPPTWRPDLVGSAHLSEEIARLDGYDKIPLRLPRPKEPKGISVQQESRRLIARTLAEYGLTQVLSFPFISEDVLDKQGILPSDKRRILAKLSNPLGDDQPYMRTSILDTLLTTASRNVSRGLTDCSVYEIGRITRPGNAVPMETPGVEQRPSDEEIAGLYKGVPMQPFHVAGVLTGAWQRPGPLGAGRHVDWADAVEAVSRMAQAVGTDIKIMDRDVRPATEHWALNAPGKDPGSVAPFHPGRCARIIVRGSTIGLAGELHPEVCRAFGVGQRACAFEVDVERLIAAARRPDYTVQSVATYPAAKEDFAFVLDEDINAADVRDVMVKQLGDWCEEVRLFDIYTGDQVDDGKKSLAFSVRMRAGDHTLSTEEINSMRQRLIKVVAKKYKATLRS
ncbi:MAG: phenylalanine--tRNA ligase subunit beta [Actinomycetaceae bacterium]|nr:phenylalanine--tRNA ligase subunit beta [Actinomycetaceae bacterium]